MSLKNQPILAEIPDLERIGRGTSFRAIKDDNVEDESKETLNPPSVFGFTYVETGTFRFQIENKIFEISPGQGYISQPNEYIRSIDGMWHPSKSYWLVIDFKSNRRKKGQSFLGLPKKEADELIRSLKHIRQRIFYVPHDIVKDFDFILESIEMPQNHLLNAKIRHHLFEILTKIIDADQKTALHNYSVMIQETIRLMEDHLNEPLSLSQIVKKLGWSISYFNKKFKEEVGISPAEYYLRKRIAKAQTQLQETNRTINAISLEAGFSTDSYFIRAFKRLLGVTPQIYRSKYLQQLKK